VARSQSSEWKIQEGIRWPAILGIGFGVPALITFVVSTSQRVSSGYGFTMVLSALSFLFFSWDWRKHHRPLDFLRLVEVRIVPTEFREGDIVSCEVYVPVSTKIRVRSWSFGIAIVEPGDDIPEFESQVFCETGFVAEAHYEGSGGNRVTLSSELLIPKRPNLPASETISLRADVSVRLRLGLWGTWSQYMAVPIKRVPPVPHLAGNPPH